MPNFDQHLLTLIQDTLTSWRLPQVGTGSVIQSISVWTLMRKSLSSNRNQIEFWLLLLNCNNSKLKLMNVLTSYLPTHLARKSHNLDQLAQGRTQVEVLKLRKHWNYQQVWGCQRNPEDKLQLKTNFHCKRNEFLLSIILTYRLNLPPGPAPTTQYSWWTFEVPSDKFKLVKTNKSEMAMVQDVIISQRRPRKNQNYGRERLLYLRLYRKTA